ncbi:MAG: ATP-dependent DNA helicase [Rubrivivax sp.]|nr:MAG: ATP-dependent DNA helicase [Rubrivivax sp.]
MKYTVAVRALCEFTAKQGDLDLRFTPSPSAQEGIAGHALVASRRGASYQSEVGLSGEFKHLLIRGRADGYDAAAQRLEEVKTFRGRLDRQPENHRHLHWAQLKVYGWLLCAERGLPALDLALVYFDIGTQDETVLRERWAADDLKAHFEALCERFLDWADQELAHRAARDWALTALPFPHADFRTGQRPLAEAVYKANSAGRCLMVQAPTGIGKTIGTLFPLLKACPAQKLDKVFFLTAKTSGRAVALNALGLIKRSAPALPLRVIELVAKDKACEHPDKACHGASCPLAQGFYDRLPQARQAAVAAGTLDKATLRSVALAHEVCPYYLGQELVRWSDAVVGDYNHYFDLNAMLHGLSVGQPWRVSVLVDEAHNLVERARKMYSAELDQTSLRAARQSAPEPLRKKLDRIHRAWQALNKAQTEPYQVHAEPPESFMLALQQGTHALTEYFADHPTAVDGALQAFYFEALHFTRLSESFGGHSLFDISRAAKHSTLCLRNVVPASFLKQRFLTARSVTLFSATLRPQRFYSDLLGLPDNTAWVDVDSPFKDEQLAVRVAADISTRYQHRQASLPKVVELMARQYEQQPGNYLAFFSSFDYLDEVARLWAARMPQVACWQQSRRMTEADQAQFLARFTDEGQGMGFAVLGGSFAEGIDLAGRRLIGAFIATLGMPQVNPVNEQIRQRMAELFGEGDGHAYTYLYPGLQKVVQAAGRVIRTQTDQGVVHLMDDRFQRPQVRALLPTWWRVA